MFRHLESSTTYRETQSDEYNDPVKYFLAGQRIERVPTIHRFIRSFDGETQQIRFLFLQLSKMYRIEEMTQSFDNISAHNIRLRVSRDMVLES